MAELLLSDFSAGMDAITAVDKLNTNACLLAENVRLDEKGSMLSAGAVTIQNTSATYFDTAGHVNVHSLYWNPSFGAVAGVGQDVFTGPTLGGMTRALTAGNPNQEKMSFSSAPGRVYFDVGEVGYWTDLTNFLTVDWLPPTIASGSVITNSATAGTAAQSGTGTAWTQTGGITGTSSFAIATVGSYAFGYPTKALTGTGFGFAVNTASTVRGVTITFAGKFQKTGGNHNAATLQASLLIGGTPVGVSAQTTNLTSALTTYTLGRSDYLWNTFGITPAQVNASSFGVQIFGLVDSATAGIFSIQNVVVTVYQSPAGLVAGIGGAGGLTGTYTWKVTFVAANGEESDASQDSNSIVLAAQSGTLTGIPMGDARTTARNIYRQGGALTSHYLVGSIPDNASTTFNDSSTDITVLATGVILAGDVQGDFPNSRLGNQLVKAPTYHYDRVFWVTEAQTNKIIWSKPLNGFAYPAVNFFNVGDSKPIYKIVSVFGELIIFKSDSIWRLTGTDETSFSLSQTPSAVGTDEAYSICVLPDKIIFHNRWGFWVFNGYTSLALTNKLDLWIKQLDRTGVSVFGVNGFHPPEITNSVVTGNFEMVGNSEKVYWTYAEAGHSNNNAIIVFDLKHGNITKRTGAPSYSLAIDPVTGFVYAGTDGGFVVQLDDWNGTEIGPAVPDFTGIPVNMDFQIPYIDVQRGSNKSLWALEFYINTNGQSVTPYVYYDNGQASEALQAVSTSSLQRVVRTIESTTARKMQNFSVRLNASLSRVNSSGTPQIELVHIKAYYDIRVGRARTGQT